MGYRQAYEEFWKRWQDFSGRSSRAAYWKVFLINLVIGVVLNLLEVRSSALGLVYLLYTLAAIVPGLALDIRRLHDTNRSGWWLFIGLIPILGWIVLIYFFACPSVAGEGKYGPPPAQTMF